MKEFFATVTDLNGITFGFPVSARSLDGAEAKVRKLAPTVKLNRLRPILPRTA